MNLSTAILLGLVQGVAEFLPISSSGHLAIASNLLNMDNMQDIPEFFDVLLHLGTLFAVFAAYRKEIWELILAFFRWTSDIRQQRRTARDIPARRMILLLIAATLPLVLVLPLRGLIRGLNDNMQFVGFALLFTGVLLFLCDCVKKGHKTEQNAGLRDAFVVGFAQLLATCPGISRSGMTICAGSFMGFEREFAVRFSFFLSIPAILAANLLSLVGALSEGNINWMDMPAYLIGVVVAALTGYASICLLRYIARKRQFGFFAAYCWVIGLLTVVFSLV